MTTLCRDVPSSVHRIDPAGYAVVSVSFHAVTEICHVPVLPVLFQTASSPCGETMRQPAGPGFGAC